MWTTFYFMSKRNVGQRVGSFVLEGIYGTGVFLGVLESDVIEERGDGFDVCSVVEQVDYECVSGVVP